MTTCTLFLGFDLFLPRVDRNRISLLDKERSSSSTLDCEGKMPILLLASPALSLLGLPSSPRFRRAESRDTVRNLKKRERLFIFFINHVASSQRMGSTPRAQRSRFPERHINQMITDTPPPGGFSFVSAPLRNLVADLPRPGPGGETSTRQSPGSWLAPGGIGSGAQGRVGTQFRT